MTYSIIAFLKYKMYQVWALFLGYQNGELTQKKPASIGFLFLFFWQKCLIFLRSKSEKIGKQEQKDKTHKKLPI